MIVEAIRTRDPEAACAAMQRHLSQLLLRLDPPEQERPVLFRKK